MLLISPFIRRSFSEGGQNIPINYRPINRRFFYNITLCKKNWGRLTKVNNFFCNRLIINQLRKYFINFGLIEIHPFLGIFSTFVNNFSWNLEFMTWNLNQLITKSANHQIPHYLCPLCSLYRSK